MIRTPLEPLSHLCSLTRSLTVIELPCAIGVQGSAGDRALVALGIDQGSELRTPEDGGALLLREYQGSPLPVHDDGPHRDRDRPLRKEAADAQPQVLRLAMTIHEELFDGPDLLAQRIEGRVTPRRLPVARPTCCVPYDSSLRGPFALLPYVPGGPLRASEGLASSQINPHGDPMPGPAGDTSRRASSCLVASRAPRI